MRTQTQDVVHWILERERIRVKRARGEPAPWTKDPILRKYRFCNVRREDDAVTRWVANNWRDMNGGKASLTRAMVLARCVNWPPTLKRIGYPSPWNNTRIIDTIHECMGEGKAWGSAYIVSTNGAAMDKAEYIVRHVCANVPWEQLQQATLEAAWTVLRRCRGLGSFMAAQIVADLKNTPGHALRAATDWYTWAASGPGSLRGLTAYWQRPVQADFLGYLHRMRDEVQPHVENAVGELHAQDWQNICCEIDKYWRAKSGLGRPKADYKPNPDFT